MKKIIFFDTTLRDGEQMAGVNISISDKLRIANLLSEMGVSVIEAGFPCSSKNDFTATSKIASSLKGCSVAGLSRAAVGDIDICWDAIKNAESPRIHVFVATSDIHLKYKLKKSREEILEMISSSVAYAKKYCSDVQFSAEDASRTDNDFLVEAFQTAIKAGATTVNIADTVGYAVPFDFEKKIRYVYENTKGMENAVLAVHCHNDLGLAVSNTIAGVCGGATQLDCTINGIGERAGNASLEELAMCIAVRKDILGAEHNINTKLLTKASKLITNLTGVYVSQNKPIVGSNVFAHESGIH
jgi:2-isopropylmalate synthase